jgi:hypothetical protein
VGHTLVDTLYIKNKENTLSYNSGVIPLNISQYNQQKKYYQVKFPCGVITKGGKYGLRVHHEMFDFTEVTNFWSYNESFDMTSIISVETPSNVSIIDKGRLIKI